MSARETILQEVRGYVSGVTGLAANSVLIGPIGETRPAVPYATVTLTMPHAPVSSPEVVYLLVAGVAHQTMSQAIRATASVAFFGDNASDYSLLVRMAMHDLRRRSLTEEVAITRILGAADGSAWRGTAYEIPSSVDLEVATRVTLPSTPALMADLLEYEITTERYEGDPAPLTATVTVEV